MVIDANNESIIMKNLHYFFEGRTVVIVAHRLSAVRKADQILVLQNGRILEQGQSQKNIASMPHDNDLQTRSEVSEEVLDIIQYRPHVLVRSGALFFLILILIAMFNRKWNNELLLVKVSQASGEISYPEKRRGDRG